jgi:ABC-type nitrate/sulfonate/bicarbonate transport system permease component
VTPFGTNERQRERAMNAIEHAAAIARNSGRPVKRLLRPILAGDYPNLVRIVSLGATLGVWEWYGRTVNRIFMSYPTAIIAALPAMLEKGELQRQLYVSLQELLIGAGLAVVFGTALGLLMGRYRIVDLLLDIQISALYSTPNVALIPILMLWFGLGMTSKVVIVFLAGFFPVIVNTYAGVRNVSRGLVEVALAEGASEAQVFTKIIIPASLPFIMTGIRLAMGRSVVGMVVAEMFTAVTGLGGAIVVYGNAFATDKLFVVIIVLALLGVGLTESVRLLERRLAPWKETERAG